MDYKEAVKYIESLEKNVTEPANGRMEKLLELVGNPQVKLKYIQTAGTNGKGSVSAMLASVMKACGYKTGLYNSEHLCNYNERLSINGHKIDDDVFAQLVSKVRPAADSMEDKPTEYEVLTACAMMWYAEKKCSIVVVEAGSESVGTANAISAPEIAVITNIGPESTENTAEKIRIIKKGCCCVSCEQDPSVMKIIEEKCSAENVDLIVTDNSQIRVEFDMTEGQVFTYKKEPCAIPLLGSHQRKNAAVVLETVEALRKKGWELDQSDVEHGMYAVSCPARFEIVSDEPYFVVDKGTDIQSAEAIAESLDNYFPDISRVLLIGISTEFDVSGIANILDPAAAEFVYITSGESDTMKDEDHEQLFTKCGKPVTVCSNVREGVAAAQDIAQEIHGMVCAMVPVNMAGEIRACFNLN